MTDVGAKAAAERDGTGAAWLAAGGNGRSADPPGLSPKGATAGPESL